MYCALPARIHPVRTGGLEPHLPALNLDTGLEHLDLLLSPRRDEGSPGMTSQPEALLRWLEGERLTGQPEAGAGLSSLPRGLPGGPR